MQTLISKVSVLGIDVMQISREMLDEFLGYILEQE